MQNSQLKNKKSQKELESSLKEVNLYSWNESKNGYLGALPWEKQA